MANKCYNELYFTGSDNSVKEANLFLAGLKIDEWDGAYIPGTKGYFQDLYFSNGGFHFGTRWVPDMETVKSVADRFGVGFVLDYSDPAMSLYGQARYENGGLRDIRLAASDFKQIDYLEKEDVYVYQNVRHRSMEKVSLMLLKDKIKQERPDELKHNFKQRLS